MPTKPPNEAIKILYVEDDPQVLSDWLEFMREHWGSDCRGVRSLERAKDLIDDEGYRPDVAIHDCNPLECEDDESDSAAAGSELYRLFVREHIPVVVLSGSNEAIKLQEEPYRSSPPLIWLSKEVTAEKIHRAVEAYQQWKRRQT
ncbi:hypothetical protein ACFL5Q_03580 [Planctomycetota bacterium]